MHQNLGCNSTKAPGWKANGNSNLGLHLPIEMTIFEFSQSCDNGLLRPWAKRSLQLLNPGAHRKPPLAAKTWGYPQSHETITVTFWDCAIWQRRTVLQTPDQHSQSQGVALRGLCYCCQCTASFRRLHSLRPHFPLPQPNVDNGLNPDVPHHDPGCPEDILIGSSKTFSKR